MLQEEMASVQPQVDNLHKLEVQNKTLTEQNKALMAQLELALSNVQRLEKNRTLQQASINRMEMQSRGLEVPTSRILLNNHLKKLLPFIVVEIRICLSFFTSR